MAPGLRYVNSEVTRGFFFFLHVYCIAAGGYSLSLSTMQQGCK